MRKRIYPPEEARLDLAALGYKVAESVAGEKANHLIVDRQWETAQ